VFQVAEKALRRDRVLIRDLFDFLGVKLVLVLRARDEEHIHAMTSISHA
jgi:hypothetical protein